MTPLAILLAEIRYRKINFSLSLLAVVIAVTLLVAGPILVDGYGRQTEAELAQLQSGVQQAADRVAQSEAAAAAEMTKLEDDTRKTMLRLGYNLTILHGATDMGQFWATGVPTRDMDQQYVDRLVKAPGLTMVTHVVGALRDKITWQDRTVFLAGYLPETTQSHRRKQLPTSYKVDPGTVFLGWQLAHEWKDGQPVQTVKEGATVEVLGKSFRVARLLPELGSQMDNTIVMHLDDAQAVLKKPGKVNEILALDCRCAEADLPKIRSQVAAILPECFVSRADALAAARSAQRAKVAEGHQQVIARQKADLEARQRHLDDTAASRGRIQHAMVALADVVTPLVVLAAAVWVGLLAMANVRERMTEIGVLRALGKGSGMIASLFLGKAVLLGILGGAAGLLLGAGMAWLLAVRTLELPAGQFHLPMSVLLTALVGAPLISALASYLPTLSALTQDPAIVLRDQ